MYWNNKDFKIIKASAKNKSDWLFLRSKLWSDCTLATHKKEVGDILKKRTKDAFIAYLDKKPVGCVECSIQKEADGCETDRIGYVEGWYVEKSFRKQGIGKKLIKTVEEWAKNKGCKEMASDAEFVNKTSQKAHQALGYKKVNTLVHLKKSLK